MKLTLFVVPLGLTFDVELSIPGVIADPAVVHPVSPVAVYIVIDQQAFKIGGADAPVLFQVLGPKARDILSTSVAHPAGLGDFFHIGVDKRLFSVSGRPMFLGFDRTIPGIIFFQDTPDLKNLAPVLERHVFKVIPPNQFKDQPVGTIVLFHLFFEILDFSIDGPRRDAAIGEPW